MPQSKTCAILLTATRPLLPADEGDCLIAEKGVAQKVFDYLMDLLDLATAENQSKLAFYTVTPAVEGIEADALNKYRLWIVNTAEFKDVQAITAYLELSQKEMNDLQHGLVIV